LRIASALRASFFVALAALIGSAPASALNRINDYYGMNLSSGWVIQSQRDVRLGFGQLIYDMFGSTNGAFSHIAVTPSTGLFVQVGPSAPNTRGSVYQFQPDDANVYGAGATQLSADPTQIFVQGALSTPTIALGPFTAPTQTGQSISDLIECQVQTVDATPQTELFETAPSTTISQTANRDRNDVVACQIKNGTATTAVPTAPTADVSWVPIASVFVSNAQTSLGSNNVTMSTANQFYGFATLDATGSIKLQHGDYANTNLSNVSSVASLAIGSGATAVSGYSLVINGGNLGLNGYQLTTGSSSYGATGASVNGALLANTFATNGSTTPSGYVASFGGAVGLNGYALNTGSSSYGATSASVNGTITATGFASNGSTLPSGYASVLNGNLGLSGSTLYTGGSSYGATSATVSGPIVGSSFQSPNTTLPSGYAANFAGNVGLGGSSLYTGGSSYGATSATIAGTVFASGFSSTGMTLPSGYAGVLNGNLGLSGSTLYTGGSSYGATSATVSGTVFASGFSSTGSTLPSGYAGVLNGNLGLSGNALYTGGSSYGATSATVAGPLTSIGTVTGAAIVTTGMSLPTNTYVASFGGDVGLNGHIMNTGSSQYGPTSATIGGPILANGFVSNGTTLPSGDAANFGGPIAATRYDTNSARVLKDDISALRADPLSIVRTVHPTWWKYKARPHMDRQLGVIADDTASELSGPKHDHIDIGATAVVAAAAAHEVDEHEQALQKRFDALAARSGVPTTPVASQSALDALTKRVDSLEVIVVFLLILSGGLIVSSIMLWRVVLKLTRAQRAAA